VKTKAICTIGPASADVDVLCDLIDNGMSIARLKLSNGFPYEYYACIVANIREAAARCKRVVAVMVDTRGGAIRTGKLSGDVREVEFLGGEPFAFYARPPQDFQGSRRGVGIDFPDLADVVDVGQKIIVDGMLSFTVVGIDQADGVISCRVDWPGVLGEGKRVAVPGAEMGMPSITPKDEKDIDYFTGLGVDIIALSYVRRAKDVEAVRARFADGHKPLLLARIECVAALKNFDQILETADGIVIARGEIGVEVAIERVAPAQKMMIGKCNAAGKPAVVATHLLESMVAHPIPTRAEATDVSNAVYDGADCLVLSNETAKGRHPVDALRTLSRICGQAEGDIDYRALYMRLRSSVRNPPIPVAESVASSAVKSAWDVSAKAIICLTETGGTARYVAKYRSACPMLAVTNSDRVARQLQLFHGVVPFLVESMKGSAKLVERAIAFAETIGMLSKGDAVVITSGVSEQVPGSTSMFKVHVVGEPY